MARAQPRILCIDNNASSNLAVYLLERVGYEVKMASSLAEAVELAQVERFDLQLVNHRLVDGLEIDSCEKLHKFAPRSPILFYSTVTYPYEQIQPIHCRQHHHTMATVYVYDVVAHASRLLKPKPVMRGNGTMSDYIARKRLKQKVLERWENEGGRIEAAALASADRIICTGDLESEGNTAAARKSEGYNSQFSQGKRKPVRK